MSHFMANIAHNGRLVPRQRNQSRNCPMGNITSQSIGKHYLGPSKPSPGSSIRTGGRQKLAIFWQKIAHDGRLVPRQRNQFAVEPAIMGYF